jgi:hypothetical protein
MVTVPGRAQQRRAAAVHVQRVHWLGPLHGRVLRGRGRHLLCERSGQPRQQQDAHCHAIQVLDDANGGFFTTAEEGADQAAEEGPEHMPEGFFEGLFADVLDDDLAMLAAIKAKVAQDWADGPPDY